MLRYLTSALLAGGMAIQATATQADFIGDAAGSLELRNFYFSRDFRSPGAAQSRREEWAQGFILNLQSGYTPGRIGFGVDAIGTLGIKLDSSAERTGTGLLAFDSERNVEDNYSNLTLAARMRMGQSELRFGGMHTNLPLLWSNNSRLLPHLFRGAMLTVDDVEPLGFTLLRVNRSKQRNGSGFESMTTFGYRQVEADYLNYFAVDYQAAPGLQLRYHQVELSDQYRSHFAGLKLEQPLATGALMADIRYFDANDIGSKDIGQVDNRTLSSLFAYQLAGHSIGVGYQKARGSTPFAFVNGTDTYLFAESLASFFSAPRERVRILRYTYNFANAGIPGLTLAVKYAKGDQVDPALLSTRQAAELRAAGRQGREWERMMDLAYTIQSGPLKDLSVQWRNSTNRSSYADSADENRLIVRYTLNF